MKLYPKDFSPVVVDDKPVVSAAKKTEVLNKMKAHMTSSNRGFYKKELIDFVQAELHKTHLHARDDDVAEWIEDVDKEWGWHPSAESVEPIEGEEV